MTSKSEVMKLRWQRVREGKIPPPKHNKPLHERFWAKVDKGPHEGDCWLWTACTLSGGRTMPYGIIQDQGIAKKAHRVSYEFAHDTELQPGVCVMHTCDNPRCVNPDHLVLGSHSDNLADRDAKGRQARGESAGGNKYAAKDIKAVRALYATGKWSQTAIAKMFGMSQQTISEIVRRKTWKDA